MMATGDAVYGGHWYAWPVRQRRFVAAMVQQMQRPRYMSGMGIVACSLKSFTAVCAYA